MVEALRPNTFTVAFLQGLAVVFFLYAVIFTASIFSGGKGSSADSLASAMIPISRTEQIPAEAVPPAHEPQAAQTLPQETLHPEDHVPAPQDHTDAVAPPSGQDGIAQDMVETTPWGPLPKISPAGLTPFKVYKKSYISTNSPVIALAVLDYGLSESDSKEALKSLPPEISLFLNPYSQTPDVWKGLANAEGHEFWIYLPAENQVYPAHEDPGPQALLAHSDFKYNKEKFIWALTRTTGYAGIASYTDAAFLNAQSALKTLWDEAYSRGLGYFEVNPAGLEGLEMNAIEKKAPYIRAQAIYDESIQTTEQWLKDLELEAQNSGYAIGVIRHPYPAIVEAISAWSNDLSSRGFSLAPVSVLAQVNDTEVKDTPAVPLSHDEHHASPQE